MDLCDMSTQYVRCCIIYGSSTNRLRQNLEKAEIYFDSWKIGQSWNECDSQGIDLDVKAILEQKRIHMINAIISTT